MPVSGRDTHGEIQVKLSTRSIIMSLLLLAVIIIAAEGCSIGNLVGEPRSEVEIQATIAAVATIWTPLVTPDVDTPTPEPTANSSPQPTQTTKTPTATPEAVCTSTHGRIELREMVTDLLNYPLGMRIYLPPCYDEEPGQKYPVIYLLHATGAKDDQWDNLGIADVADRLITSGDAPPFIIVMPWEMTSSEDDKVSPFGDALVNALIPWVDRTYPTCTLRECRSIGGIMRGAAWAMRLGMTHWELFSSIGAHSFAPFPGDFYNIPFWLKEIPAGEWPRIYIDIGTLDINLEPASLFEARLTDYGIPHEWVIGVGSHNDEYWTRQLESYLRWYTLPWKLSLPQDISSLPEPTIPAAATPLQ
jgi:enterochelin esterase-like enzyme